MTAPPDLPLRATARIRRHQRIALTLLVGSAAVNYVDRATLAVANPLIRADLHLNVAQMGALLSVFLWAYAIAQLPAGWVVDKFGPRIALGVAVALWSVAQGIAGLSSSFLQFAAARVGLGIGEAPQSPAAARVVRDGFAPSERGTATGVWNCGGTLGTAAAAPLLTGLMLWLGWRGMFLVMAVAGVGVAAIWYALYREPADLVLSADESRYLGRETSGGPKSSISWREWGLLLRSRTTWGLTGGFFGAIYLVWIYTAWLPSYLEMERHMSIRRSGFVAALPFIAGVVGSLVGGRWFDRWTRGSAPEAMAGRFPAAICLLGMSGFTVAAALVVTSTAAIVCICAAMFLGYAACSCAWGIVASAVSAERTGTLGSIQNFGGYIGGALAALMTGLIVQRFGSFVPALLTAAAVGVLGSLAYLLVVAGPIQTSFSRRMPK